MLNGLINYIPAIKYGNLVDNAELNPATVQSATVNLTAAQLISMGNTPVTLITTTAAGTAIVPTSMVFEFNPTSTTFTTTGAIALVFGYNSVTSTGNIMSATILAKVITSASAGYIAMEQTAVTSGFVVVPNTGLSLGTDGLSFAAGTGTAKVFINYYIVTI